jgi:hypothetical protein
MAEELSTEIAGLLCAGEGSRLRTGLKQLGEVTEVDRRFYFAKSSKPFEKSLTEIVPPDPRVKTDKGVTILDLAVKDVLLIPTLKTIRFLVNEGSQIPDRYQEGIDRELFLKRLGLPALKGDGVSPNVGCEYLVQPAKSDRYPFYGTAWAFHLVSEGVKLGENELMMVTETDSGFIDEPGISIPASMLQALQNNRRGATAAISVAPLKDEVSRSNGLGAVLMTRYSEEYYFDKVLVGRNCRRRQAWPKHDASSL